MNSLTIPTHWLKIASIIYFFIGIILATNSIADSTRLSVKSLVALADSKRMILHNNCLWVAGGGLTQYDIGSNRARNYVKEQGLISNAVFDALMDQKNSALWAGTSSGLGRLDLKTGNWNSFGKREGLNDPFVLSLGMYSYQGKSVVLIGTRTEGIFILKEGLNEIAPALDKKDLPDQWVSCITPDVPRNYIWVGTTSGVVRFIPGDKILKADLTLSPNRIPAKRLLVDEKTGNVFCLSYSNEIFHHDVSANRWRKMPLSSYRVNYLSDLVLQNRDKLLLVATNRGIYGHKVEQNQWIKPFDYNGNVSCLALDAKNRALYFSTQEGIHFKSFMGQKSRLVLSNSPPFNNTINALAIEKKGDNIWVGADGCAAKFDRRKRMWKIYNLHPNKRERATALSLSPKTVWLGTMYNGLLRLDLGMGRIQKIGPLPDFSTVTSIISDAKTKKVWFSILGIRGGVYEYHMGNRKLRTIPFLNGLSVTSLLEDGDWIWVGTSKGVAKFHKHRDPYGSPLEEALSFNDVLTLALDSKRNHLWITTEYEVIRYDISKKEVKIFDAASGFPPSPITSTLFDGERVWFGSEGEGLFKYNPLENAKNLLSKVEGIADRYIISLAFDDKEKALWVGTVSGGISVIRWNNPPERDVPSVSKLDFLYQ